MRTSLLLLLGVCIGVAFAEEWISPSYTSPVLMWSNKNYFSSQQQKVEVTNAQQILSTIVEAAKQNPEVVLVFVESQLRTEQVGILTDAYQSQTNGGAFENVKSLLSSSTSSITLPYVTVSGQDNTIASYIVNELNTILEKNKKGKRYMIGSTATMYSTSRTVDLEVHELLNLLSTSDILSNGVTDIIVVCFDSHSELHVVDNEQVKQQYKQDDETIGSIVKAVSKSSYVAMVTADKPVSSVTLSFPQQHKSLSNFESRNIQSVGSDDSDNPFPQPITEALIVMIPFLLILSVGVCCTFGVQSDLKFDAEKPKKY